MNGLSLPVFISALNLKRAAFLSVEADRETERLS